MDRWTIEKRIAIECAKNPKFKKKFLAHPKNTIMELFKGDKHFNSKEAHKIHFVVYEEKENEMLIPIPFIEAGHVISDEILKKVAGGTNETCLDLTGCP